MLTASAWLAYPFFKLRVGVGASGTLEVFGCSYGHLHSYVLGGPPKCNTAGPCESVERETLAGPLVAYQEFQSTSCCTRWLVMVRDLRTGRVIRRLPTGSANPHEPLLVGNGQRTVAIAREERRLGCLDQRIQLYSAEYEVHAVDRSGSRVLSAGADIDPHSLALAGSTLYWIQAGKPMSAPAELRQTPASKSNAPGTFPRTGPQQRLAAQPAGS